MLIAAGVATAAVSATPDGGIDASDGALDAHQHGVTPGHLMPEGSQENVALVSKLKPKNAGDGSQRSRSSSAACARSPRRWRT